MRPPHDRGGRVGGNTTAPPRAGRDLDNAAAAAQQESPAVGKVQPPGDRSLLVTIYRLLGTPKKQKRSHILITQKPLQFSGMTMDRGTLGVAERLVVRS